MVRTPVAGPVRIGSLLTVKQVAARLGVAAATVYGLCGERRELHHVRVGNAIRVSPDALEAFLHAATAGASKRRQMPSSENADATAASSPTSAASAIPSEGERR
ncbi:MAG TPA: helix-turn-helix domain-containing protein [Myxococcales bacterium]